MKSLRKPWRLQMKSGDYGLPIRSFKTREAAVKAARKLKPAGEVGWSAQIWEESYEEKHHGAEYVAPVWAQILAALRRADRVKEWCRQAGCSPAWLEARDPERIAPWWAHSLLRGMELEVDHG